MDLDGDLFHRGEESSVILRTQEHAAHVARLSAVNKINFITNFLLLCKMY